MERFEYLEPTSVEEACTLLRRYGDEAKVLAGGQSLLPMMRLRMASPRYLVSLAGISQLRQMSYSEEAGLTIGAMVSHGEVEYSPLVRSRLNLLSQVASLVGSPPIRNLGTIGGDLCHNECGADPPASLLALGARVKLARAGGHRTMDLQDFFVDYFQTALEPDEILTEIQVPPLALHSGAAYLKLRRRVVDPAIVGAAVCLTMESGDGACTEARIGLSGVAPVPLRAVKAEQVLKEGGTLTVSLVQEAARAASQETAPLTDAFASEGYRREMTEVFVRRALVQAMELARAN